jgi:hypothetical protein
MSEHGFLIYQRPAISVGRSRRFATRHDSCARYVRLHSSAFAGVTCPKLRGRVPACRGDYLDDAWRRRAGEALSEEAQPWHQSNCSGWWPGALGVAPQGLLLTGCGLLGCR